MGHDLVTCDGCDRDMFFENIMESGLCRKCDNSPKALRDEIKRVGKRANMWIDFLKVENTKLREALKNVRDEEVCSVMKTSKNYDKLLVAALKNIAIEALE